jgi:hypothetical protein
LAGDHSSLGEKATGGGNLCAIALSGQRMGKRRIAYGMLVVRHFVWENMRSGPGLFLLVAATVGALAHLVVTAAPAGL